MQPCPPCLCFTVFYLFSPTIFYHRPSPLFPPLLLETELRASCKVQAGTVTWATSLFFFLQFYLLFILEAGSCWLVQWPGTHCTVCWPPFSSDFASVTGVLGLGVGAILLCAQSSPELSSVALPFPCLHKAEEERPPPCLLLAFWLPISQPLLLSLLRVNCRASVRLSFKGRNNASILICANAHISYKSTASENLSDLSSRSFQKRKCSAFGKNQCLCFWEHWCFPIVLLGEKISPTRRGIRTAFKKWLALNFPEQLSLQTDCSCFHKPHSLKLFA